MQVKILHVSTIGRFSRNWTNEFALKNIINSLRKKETPIKNISKYLYEKKIQFCIKEIKINCGEKLWSKNLHCKNNTLFYIKSPLLAFLKINVSIISWASSKSARSEEEWKAIVATTNSLVSRLLTLCPDKRPRGEDPPTKFLCVCRGPSVDSTNSFELVCVTGFFEILTAGQTMSSNYRRCAMIGPGEPSTDTLPESLRISVVSIDLTYTKSYTLRSLQECPPRCDDASSLILRSYCSLFDDIWQLAFFEFQITIHGNVCQLEKKARSNICLVRHFCGIYSISLEFKYCVDKRLFLRLDYA